MSQSKSPKSKRSTGPGRGKPGERPSQAGRKPLRSDGSEPRPERLPSVPQASPAKRGASRKASRR